MWGGGQGVSEENINSSAKSHSCDILDKMPNANGQHTKGDYMACLLGVALVWLEVFIYFYGLGADGSKKGK